MNCYPVSTTLLTRFRGVQELSIISPGEFDAARLKVRRKMLGTLLIILLVLALVGAVPRWGYSRDWGYYPSGGLGLVLLIVLILVLMGRI
jgi:hypothetical protein